jgi:hypothetical protein
MTVRLLNVYRSATGTDDPLTLDPVDTSTAARQHLPRRVAIAVAQQLDNLDAWPRRRA